MTKRMTILALAFILSFAALETGVPGRAEAASTRITMRGMAAKSFRGIVRAPILIQNQRSRRRDFIFRRKAAPRRRVFTPSRRVNPRRFGGVSRRASRVRPLSSVARNALARVPGRFLGGHLVGNTYLIKVLTRQGRLVYVYANAYSGRIVRIRR
jgi:hypothetical protein